MVREIIDKRVCIYGFQLFFDLIKVSNMLHITQIGGG